MHNRCGRQRGPGGALVSVPPSGGLWGVTGAALADVHDEWQSGERRYLSEGSMALLTTTTKEVTPAQLMPA